MSHLVKLTPEEQEQAELRVVAIFEAWSALTEEHQFNSEFKNSSYLSPPLVSEIVFRYLCDVRRIKEFHRSEIENINEFKIAGYLTYWICKIRPVQLKEQLRRLTRTQNLLNELFYTLKYRTTSGDTLAQIYRYTDLF